MFHYFFGEQKWWVIEGWWNGNGLTFGKVWLRLCRCVFRKSCTLSQILLGAEIENFAWMADRNGQPDMDIDIANRTFLSSVPMKKGTCFFFQRRANQLRRVIFTRKIGQAVGPMEDDKYQPCYIPTNTLQVASSLRGCFRFRWFVFFFLVTDLSFTWFFVFSVENPQKQITKVVFHQKKTKTPASKNGEKPGVQETDAKLQEPMDKNWAEDFQPC